MAEDISFEEVVQILKASSEDAEIFVDANIETEFLEDYVETIGWNNDYSFIYFIFDFESGRWFGVQVCDEQKFVKNSSTPFVSETHGAVRELKKAIQTRDYEEMRKYVPSGKMYMWGPCGPTDALPNELYFEELNEDLRVKGKGRDIEILGGPYLSEWKGKISAGIETGGWKGDYPYITFVFELFQPGRRWAWTGVWDCRRPSARE